MIDWYDREGRPLDIMSASKLMRDFDYKVVRQQKIGPFLVSTVWLGLDHNWSNEGPPLIFETMVFDHELDDGWGWGARDVDPGGWMNRYSTEREAREGHRVIVAAVASLLEMAAADIKALVEQQDNP